MAKPIPVILYHMLQELLTDMYHGVSKDDQGRNVALVSANYYGLRLNDRLIYRGSFMTSADLLSDCEYKVSKAVVMRRDIHGQALFDVLGERDWPP
ncbi:MAG: hypothetical protein IH961_11155 [Chloroflexi bacterium]|nr:hypothetical protein [Chloroflexota bacterium]